MRETHLSKASWGFTGTFGWCAQGIAQGKHVIKEISIEAGTICSCLWHASFIKSSSHHVNTIMSLRRLLFPNALPVKLSLTRAIGRAISSRLSTHFGSLLFVPNSQNSDQDARENTHDNVPEKKSRKELRANIPERRRAQKRHIPCAMVIRYRCCARARVVDIDAQGIMISLVNKNYKVSLLCLRGVPVMAGFPPRASLWCASTISVS